MEEMQMDYVIKKIRQNEEKTEELTTVLEGFHQSFDKLLGNIERVLEVGTIDQATKSVRQLDTHLGRIEKQIATHQKEEKVALGQVTDTLTGIEKRLGYTKVVENTQTRSVKKSAKSVFCNDEVYLVDETGLELTKFSLKESTYSTVYSSMYAIQSLGTNGERVYFYDEEEKLYSLEDTNNCLLEEVVTYEMTAYGIVYQNKLGNIKLYKYDGMQKSLAKRVTYFEVVGERYLLFQGTKPELQLLDLEVLDVEHPRSIG